MESLPGGGSGEPFIAHTFENPPPAGRKGAPAGAAATAFTTQSFALTRSGDIKVRLVLVQLADKKATIPQAAAQAAITNSSNYWKTMSNGRLSMTVTKVESRTSKATSTQRYPDMMNTIAGELGWTPSTNTALVIFVSTPTLSDGAYGAGWSYPGLSGRVIMPLPATLTNSVLTHEFGHVLGLMHANSLQCGSGAQDVATNPDGTFADSSCSIREYGDSLDLMGISQRTQPAISSTLWAYGGFGRGDEIVDAGPLTGMKKFTLTAWAGTAASRAAKFTDPVSGETYFLELRLPVSYDTTEAVDLNSGVKIVQQLGAGSLILLPDSRPFAGYYNPRQTWQPGQTFTTHAGTRVSIDAITSTSASVTVESLLSIAGKAIDPVATATPALGSPTSTVTCGLRAGGCYRNFQGGSVHWTPGTGAVATVGAIGASWGALGYENGKLGYPTSGQSCGLTGGGCYQAFQGGTIHWSPASGAIATLGAIRTAWGATGYENGKLGYPLSNEICGLTGGGCYQTFQGGSIHWSPASGAFATWGATRATWASLGYEKGKLGYPSGTETCGLTSGGCYQTFQGGTIHWSPATGAVATWGGIRGAWANLGFENGKLGYPTAGEVCGLVQGGCSQAFQGGAVYYAPGVGAFATWDPIRKAWGTQGYENGKLAYPTTNATCGQDGSCDQSFQGGFIHWTAAAGAIATSGPIGTAWAALGSSRGQLGYPVASQVCGLVNGGCSQAFQGGAIHWSPATGAFATWGGIRTTWAGLGFEKGKLGYPAGKETCGLANGGCYQSFQGGTIHWSPAAGAFATWGAIRAAWGGLGYENGKLGYPVSNEICGLVNGGCYQAFQGGTIHWSPATGAFATWGGIRTTWAGLGFEKGNLGYPAGKETCGLINGGCYQSFQGGTIHWSPATGAFATSGPIRTTWGSLGYEKGRLGYPASAQNCDLVTGACSQRFQNGTITWSAAQGSVVLP
ncbi:pregnancy-associated plasma protein-A [Arthrobacter oryzae]|uniref:Pregnancy-associated plasma protein-A n=2 Tax=Arthrobacter oryzae TaxID=409290 RepID=A0A495EVN0_9MICC|nr:pregnancy-associated plasma protein-A [Arthrobacter oryzae]